MVIDAFENLMYWFQKNVLRSYAEGFCQLHGNYDDYSFFSDDGEMVTFIDVKGTSNITGENEVYEVAEKLFHSFQTLLKKPGITIQAFFVRDPWSISREIDFMQKPSRATAERLNLSMKDILDEQKSVFQKHCSYEKIVFIIWTKPEALPKNILEKDAKDMAEFSEKNNISNIGPDAVNYLKVIRALKNVHLANVNTVIDELGLNSIVSEKMEVHEALSFLRRMIDRDFTDENWKPVLLGDKIPIRHNNLKDKDISNYFYPEIKKQIFPRKTVVDDSGILEAVKIGSLYHSTFIMELPPQEPMSFNKLFQKIPHTIPWKMLMQFEPDGINNLSIITSILLNFVGFLEYNKPIKKALDGLKKLNSEIPVVKLQVSFGTWSRDMQELERNHSYLARMVQSWGSCDTTDDLGDPDAGFISCLPGFTKENIANPHYPPFSEILPMLPLLRPASPWSTGSVLFRTSDGKLFPMSPGSSLQDTWIDLLYSPPGSGKSVLLNKLGFASALSAGLTKLPMYTIIDIGPSSSGLISLIREELPDDMKHLAVYFKLKMKREYSINVFDTQLGCRRPTALHRSFLVNFLTLLGTPPGRKPYTAMSDLAGLLVDEIYDSFSGQKGKSAKTYNPGMDVKVDEALRRLKVDIRTENYSWWDIVEILFKHQYIHEATLAQRFAVPVVPDLSGIIKSTVVTDTYDVAGSPLKIDTGEKLVDAFARIINTVTREYPVLIEPTKVDFGESRIVAINLEEVANGQGEQGKKTTAIMYMLARNIAARNYQLKTDMIETEIEPNCHPMFHAYHRKRIRELEENPKCIVYDEFHRTSGQESVRQAVLIDMREGRKFNTRVSLASQMMEDFDEEMIKLATSIYMLKKGSNEDLIMARERFKLSPTAIERLDRECHGPTAKGSSFLVLFKTKLGDFTQILVNNLGSIELWAFSTTTEDVALRNRMYRVCAPNEARIRLAKMFPSGSAKAVIEKMKEEQTSSSKDIYEVLLERLLSMDINKENA
jgi:intracellular multiplication protein IcmB